MVFFSFNHLNIVHNYCFNASFVFFEILYLASTFAKLPPPFKYAFTFVNSGVFSFNQPFSSIDDTKDADSTNTHGKKSEATSKASNDEKGWLNQQIGRASCRERV